MRPVEQESGLFDVRRRWSLRRARGGEPQERSNSGRERSGSHAGSVDTVLIVLEGLPLLEMEAAARRGSAPRSEGEGISLRGDGESFEGAGIPGNEAVSQLFGCSIAFIDAIYSLYVSSLMVSPRPYW